MGQNQSNSSDESRAQEGEDTRNLYEVLGLQYDATDEEIKKSYRRKALELHPDRNYGNVEYATKLFAEIQAAYEILSDPQEKAWYDSHLSVITDKRSSGTDRRGERHSRITTSEDIVQACMKYRGQFKDCNPASAFYATLAEFFERLAQEEDLFSEAADLEQIDYPPFGSEHDSYDDVVKTFYIVWGNFSTRKSFSWKDVHRYSEAPDRRIRRMMEKENRRIRDDAIREFNEAVRMLVVCVRKRDPRYKPLAQTDVERQQALRDQSALQAARARAANQARLQHNVVPEWIHSRDEPGAEELYPEEEEDDEWQEQFECIVCRKYFKSRQQLTAHERSKKHNQAIRSLRKELQQHDRPQTSDGGGGYDVEASDHSVPAVQLDNTVAWDSDQERTASETESRSRSHTVDGLVNGSQDTHKNPPYQQWISPKPQIDCFEDDDNDHFKLNEDAEATQADDAKTAAGGEADEQDIHNDEIGSDSPVTKEPRLISSNSFGKSLQTQASDGPPHSSKLGKAKEKRARKAEREAAVAVNAEDAHRCTACQAIFPSRTRLFKHIHDFGHAKPLLSTDKPHARA